MNTSTSLGKLNRIFALFCLILALGSTHARADVATLREKGPKSGAVFSNLGLSAMSADVKIAMRDAQVKIVLKKGAGNTLLAECEANFLLENIAPTETGPQDFLVAFPVTGLNSKVVTIDKFAVTVDGKTPPTVFRQAIAISRRESKLQDKVIAGQLDARFAPETCKQQWGVGLTDDTIYPQSYAWPQSTVPGAKSIVRVTYRVALKPQTIAYGRSYTSSHDDSEVIPFENLKVDSDRGPYYFFDYILLSGSTWNEAIGHEVIELDASGLGRSGKSITCMERRQIGFPAGGQFKQREEDFFEDDVKKESDHVRLEFRNKKPQGDVLFAIRAPSM